MICANEMQRCYHRQAEAVGRVLGSRTDTLRAFTARFGGKTPRALVLLGIGSSFHALNMARRFGCALMDVPVLALTPEQLDGLPERLAKDALVLAGSQSGTSTNVLACLQRLKALGAASAVITQAPDSPIGRLADCVLPLDIPEEKAGPKTMGVLATALMAALAMCALADGDGRKTAELAAAGEAFVRLLDGNLIAARAFAEARMSALLSHPAWLVAGRKEWAAPAGEAALKLIETLRVPAAAYELEELAHGPCACFSPQTALMCLGSQWEERARPEALCGLCREAGGTVYNVLVTQEATGEREDRFYLQTPAHPLFAALTLLLPAQAISAFVPPEKGVDLDARAVSPWTDILAAHL